MADNFFDQFDDDENAKLVEHEPTAMPNLPGEEPEEFVSFDQYDSEEPQANFFDQYDDETTALPEPVAVEEMEAEPDPSIWDLAKKSYYDSKGRTLLADQVPVAQDILDLREGKRLESRDLPAGPLGFTARDLQRNIKSSGSQEQREEFADQLMGQMQATLERAQEYRAKGEAIQFSPHVQQFMQGSPDGSTTMLEDFTAQGIGGMWDIVVEIGVSSGYASLKGIGAGLVGGAIGSTAGPGGSVAGFSAGMGAASAREEFAASVAQGMVEEGLDPADPNAFLEMVADKDLMERIISKAQKRAATIGTFDGATAVIAPMRLTKGPVSNMLAQTAVQVAGGAGGEAVAQMQTEDEISGREIAAEGLGELVTGPIEVAGASVSAYRARRQQQAEGDQVARDALAEIEAAQAEAEALAEAAGGDALDVANAGADAAAAKGAEIEDRYSKMAEQMVAEDDLAAAEQADIEERQALQEEAAARYEEQKTKEAQVEEAYAQREAQKEAEVREAEYQQQVTQAAAQTEAAVDVETVTRKVEKAETTLEETPAGPKVTVGKRKTVTETQQVQKPATTTLGEAAPELARAKRTPVPKKGTKVPQRGIPRAPTVALIEDQRPTEIVVNREGEAKVMKASEVDKQIRRRWDAMEQQGLDLRDASTNIPVKVNGLDLRIENPDGTVRTGTNKKTGEKWEQKFEGVHYGNIAGVRGADNERLDVYLATENLRPSDMKAYVVDQYTPEGKFDEHKVMLGFGDIETATEAYDKHTTDMQRGAVTELSLAEFKRWTGTPGIKNKPMGSAELLEFATQEDLEAVQERAVFKGNVRPKILYKLGDAKIDVYDDVVDNYLVEGEDVRATTGPVTKVVATRGGTEVGSLNMQRRGGAMQVIWTMVDQTQRGLGVGQQLILSAVKHISAKGMELVSDTSVSVAQLRAYEALRKRGDLVVEYSDPAEVQRALREEAPNYQVEIGAMQPVVRRMFAPEFREDIQLRKTEEMVREDFDPGTVRNTIDLLVSFMPGIPAEKVQVVDMLEDLPAQYKNELLDRGAQDARGFHVAETGEIFIILENAQSAAEAIQTFMHEAVGHFGLRKMLGAELNPLLDEIWENGNQKSITAMAEKYGLDIENTEDRRTAVEEYIAHLAETVPPKNPGILKSVYEAIRQFLKRAGLLDSWSDTDIQSLLRDVRRELRYKPLDKVMLSQEAEIEETGEVVTLERPADVALRQHAKRTNVVERLRECVG